MKANQSKQGQTVNIKEGIRETKKINKNLAFIHIFFANLCFIIYSECRMSNMSCLFVYF